MSKQANKHDLIINNNKTGDEKAEYKTSITWVATNLEDVEKNELE